MIPKSTEQGTYPVSLLVTYKDDLRIEHSALLNGTVLYQLKVQGETSSGGLFGSGPKSGVLIPGVIVVIVVGAVGILLYLRRRKRSKLRSQLEKTENDDLVLDKNTSFEENIQPRENIEKEDRS
jgi:hypothetical protein